MLGQERRAIRQRSSRSSGVVRILRHTQRTHDRAGPTPRIESVTYQSMYRGRKK
jgi:hypothetical protein